MPGLFGEALGNYFGCDPFDLDPFIAYGHAGPDLSLAITLVNNGFGGDRDSPAAYDPVPNPTIRQVIYQTLEIMVGTSRQGSP